VIDSCRFAIPNRLKQAIDGVNKWQNFKDRAMAAFLVLRRNSQLIIHLSRMVFKELFPDEQIELELLRAFYLDRTEEAAVAHISDLMELGVLSVKRKIKNIAHELSANVNPKSS